MITEEDRIPNELLYKSLSDMIADRNRNAIDAFKLFISLYSAIVGGTIWLSAQSTKVLASFEPLSNHAVELVTSVAILMVYEAKRGWWGYRKTQSKLAGKTTDGKHRIPPPKLRAVLTEVVIAICMIIACWQFIQFNPLHR
jgi:hypothetical protein